MKKLRQKQYNRIQVLVDEKEPLMNNIVRYFKTKQKPVKKQLGL